MLMKEWWYGLIRKRRDVVPHARLRWRGGRQREEGHEMIKQKVEGEGGCGLGMQCMSPKSQSLCFSLLQ